MKRTFQWTLWGCWMMATIAQAADAPSAKPFYPLAPGIKWSYEETQKLMQISGSRTNVMNVKGTIEEEIFPAPAHYRENGDTVLSRSTFKQQREGDGGISESSGGSVQILEWRQDDLYLHGIRAWIDGSYSEGMNLYQPALLYLKSSGRTGDSWKVGTQKNMGADLSTIATMTGTETVTVPAGTFSNCLKVVYKSAVESLPGDMRLENGTVEDTIWFASGVGMVKESQTSYITYLTKQGRIYDREEQTKVLKSYTPAK